MPNKIFERLQQPLQPIQAALERAFNRLRLLRAKDETALDFSVVPNGANLSLDDIEGRTLLLLDLVTPLAAEKEIRSTPISLLEALKTELERPPSQIEALSAPLEAIASNGGLATISTESGTLASENGAASWSLTSWIEGVSKTIDTCLLQVYQILSIRGSASVAKHEASFAEVHKILRQLRKQVAEVSSISSEAQNEWDRLKGLTSELGTIAKESEGHRTEAEKSRRNTSEYEAEATLKVSAIRDLAAQAEKLAASVQTYQPQFEQFQAKLDERDRTFAEGRGKLDQLTTTIDKKQSEIERLNSQAEDMLKGATVAGLASSFGQIRDKLTGELRWARFGFYFAVALLFVSALPLVVYVLPGLDLPIFRPESGPADFQIGQVAIRALLLIPAAWLCKFAAARHAVLFRLREHYAYKYSIASSVEGFKKQAPTFQEGIAASTFHELTFNPADRMELKGQDVGHPNPAMDWLLRKIGATPDGKVE